MLGDILHKPSTKLYINSSTTGHEGWSLMSGGGALICGGSSCTVADLEFPAGINHKLLFKINTMINTVCGTSMPAENCTDPSKILNNLFARKLWKQIGANKWRRYPKPAIVAIAAETPLAKPIPHSSHQNIIVGGSQLVRGGNKGGKCAYFNVMIIHSFGVMFLYLCTG